MASSGSESETAQQVQAESPSSRSAQMQAQASTHSSHAGLRDRWEYNTLNAHVDRENFSGSDDEIEKYLDRET